MGRSKAYKGSPLVPLKPLQDRFRELEARGVTAGDIAYRLGWVYSAGHRSAGHGDGSKLLRAIGLRLERDGKGRRAHRTQATEESVLKIAQAMDLDPWEVGL